MEMSDYDCDLNFERRNGGMAVKEKINLNSIEVMNL